MEEFSFNACFIHCIMEDFSFTNMFGLPCLFESSICSSLYRCVTQTDMTHCFNEAINMRFVLRQRLRFISFTCQKLEGSKALTFRNNKGLVWNKCRMVTWIWFEWFRRMMLCWGQIGQVISVISCLTNERVAALIFRNPIFRQQVLPQVSLKRWILNLPNLRHLGQGGKQAAKQSVSNWLPLWHHLCVSCRSCCATFVL